MSSFQEDAQPLSIHLGRLTTFAFVVSSIFFLIQFIGGFSGTFFGEFSFGGLTILLFVCSIILWTGHQQWQGPGSDLFAGWLFVAGSYPIFVILIRGILGVSIRGIAVPQGFEVFGGISLLFYTIEPWWLLVADGVLIGAFFWLGDIVAIPQNNQLQYLFWGIVGGVGVSSIPSPIYLVAEFFGDITLPYMWSWDSEFWSVVGTGTPDILLVGMLPVLFVFIGALRDTT